MRARRRLSDRARRAPTGSSSRTSRSGVAVLVTPWNFPAAMATRKIGPALAAGCTVVLKPATETPLTALAIWPTARPRPACRPASSTSSPRRSAGAVGGRRCSHDPRVRKLSFTGSTEVGRVLLREAAEHGGQLLDGARRQRAVHRLRRRRPRRGASTGAMVAKMRNGGEACTAANRFYVHAGVAEEFPRGWPSGMGALRVGPGPRRGRTRSGRWSTGEPATRSPSWSTTPSTRGAARPDRRHRARRRGLLLPAHGADDVPPDAEILREEIFGPVAPVVAVRRPRTRRSRWPTTPSTAWSPTSSPATWRRGLRGLGAARQPGMVGLNRGVVSDPAAPFGGIKQSGLGREGGHEGILEFLETQVHRRRLVTRRRRRRECHDLSAAAGFIRASRRGPDAGRSTPAARSRSARRGAPCRDR